MENRNKLTERTIQHYEEARAKGSTGAINSMYEVAIKRTLARNFKNIEYTTASGKADIRIGRNTWVEVKSCCSETGTTEDPLACITRSRYVIYTPDLPSLDTIENNAIEVLEQSYIFTSEEFIEMLGAIHKGEGLHIKYNKPTTTKQGKKRGGRWNIQTLATKMPSGKWTTCPLDRFYEFVEEHRIPFATLELIDSLRK